MHIMIDSASSMSCASVIIVLWPEYKKTGKLRIAIKCLDAVQYVARMQGYHFITDSDIMHIKRRAALEIAVNFHVEFPCILV